MSDAGLWHEGGDEEAAIRGMKAAFLYRQHA